MINLLKSAYPFYEDSKQGFKICLGIGFFILTFCVLFKPFGLDQISTIKQIGYGIVSFLVCGFYIILLPLIFKKVLKIEGWKIYKEILWVSLITFSLAFANYFYTGFAFEAGYSFNINSFFLILLYTSIIAIIPAITIILYKQLVVYKKIIKEVKKIDAKLISQNAYINQNVKQNILIINSETKKDKLQLNSNDFMFLASSGNYVEFYFTNGNDIQKKIIRNNISKVEKQLKKFNRFVRCHRSYIVNLDRVTHVTGNLQGYQLYFKNIDYQIPVSRSYTKTIKSKVINT